jgi:tripartite-type tricarboxylate transporter receptor subunit TctC
VKVLHDAFKKGLEDPEVLKVLERLDQELAYLNSSEYAALASKTFQEEGAIVKRLGLKM